MNFLEELKWRGLLKNVSDGLEEALEQGSITAYIGYDPTAPSMTIGNLVTIMLLKHLQLHGHRPIVLMGGATGKIGDPSGKDAERQLLSYDVIDQNIAIFRTQFKRFLDFEGENAAIFENNEDFYQGMDVFTFLRDIGKNITVNYMMAKDSVKNRIEKEQGLSFTEFSYQLIQGYDFQHLYEKYGCVLQMGGSDQWGNITTGTHFVGKAGGKAYGLTCPLLTKADGAKIGKSEGGNIWLAAEKTSPYQFYQYWIHKISDADIEKMLKIFSLKTPEEIQALLDEHLESDPRQLKHLLAEELTTRVHSKEACEGAIKASQIAFNKKLKPAFLQALTSEELEMLTKEMPTFYIDMGLFENGMQADDLLMSSHDSLKSKSDIRRAIKSKALSVNAEKLDAHTQELKPEQLLQDKLLFVQHGKKKFLGLPYRLTEIEEFFLQERYEALKMANTAAEEVPQYHTASNEEAETPPHVQNLIDKGYLSDPRSLTNKGLLAGEFLTDGY
jgi:tyrosyl-tRNA synthetase